MALNQPTQKPFQNSDKGNLYLALMALAVAFDPTLTPPDPTTNLVDPTLKPFENSDEGNIYLALEAIATAYANGTGNKVSYIASLVQAGAAAPTATVLINTTGDVGVWSRASAGTYRLTFGTDVFVDDTRVVVSANASTISSSISSTIVSSKILEIVNYDALTPGKLDGLANVGVIVDIYP